MPINADFAARNFRKQGHSDPGCGVNAYFPMGAPFYKAFAGNSTSTFHTAVIGAGR